MNENKSATGDQLHAAIRLAAWRPEEYRTQASQIEAGTHDLSAVLPASAIAATVAGMRAEADKIEAAGQEAREELDRRTSVRAKTDRRSELPYSVLKTYR